MCVGQSFSNKNENILKIIAYLFGMCKYMPYIYNIIITQKQKDMKTLENKIKQATTETLIETLTTIFKDMSKASLNVMIQEELENRIGEDKLDAILDEIR